MYNYRLKYIYNYSFRKRHTWMIADKGCKMKIDNIRCNKNTERLKKNVEDTILVW